MNKRKNNIHEYLQNLKACLRHSYGTDRPVLSSLGKQTWTKTLTRPQQDQDTSTMNVSFIWRRRLRDFSKGVSHFVWVVVIYLSTELIIWGLSRTLAGVHLEFFASIMGMVLTFAIVTTTYLLFQRSDDFYRRYIKSKIDFINAHLGLGFPIPLVMLNQSDILGGREIGMVIGNFVVTNLVSWTTIFAISFLIMTLAFRLRLKPDTNTADDSLPRPLTATPPRIEVSWLSDSGSTCAGSERGKSTHCVTPDPGVEPLQSSTRRSSIEITARSAADNSAWWNFCVANFPLLASVTGIFLIGAPVAAATGEQRVLDGCVLWFVWVSSLRVQRGFKTSKLCLFAPKLKDAIATLMNPVLFTTLLMTAYTRAKAAAISIRSLAEVLRIFSNGVPLCTLWTAYVTGEQHPNGVSRWFGAGDAALSILECGIFIWGFKLYECRHQVFSIAGLLTILVSIAAAAGNVFLPVLSGRLMGLDRAVSLAFAARSTTLALAKPAMQAIGGNPGANAALVVSNGILGQLIYPFALEKLGVKHEESDIEKKALSVSSDGNVSDGTLFGTQESNQITSQSESKPENPHDDGAVTIAAGITIGVNGAAMGVAYLYATKSRAAPYAALAMTVFGIMTVFFTTVEPFQGVLRDLAG